MKKVYEGDPIMVRAVQSLLEGDSIPAVVEGEALFEVRGEFPAPWPAVWVADEDVERAIETIRRQQSPNGKQWRCPKCEENIEDQFQQCWKCGAGRGETGG